MKTFRLWLGKRGELRHEISCFLFHPEEVRQGRLSLVLKVEAEAGFDWVGELIPRPYEEEFSGTVTLYTSGTTGEPKAVTRRFADVIEGKRGRGSSTERWLLTYHPFRWAGVSMITHVLRWGAQLIVPESLEIGDVLTAAPLATHVSLTPSLFRKMLLTSSEVELSKLSFSQITFGGEPATQPVLDAAKRCWPSARITHTYASTELGDIWSVSDGLAGVPQAKMSSLEFDSNGVLYVNGRSTGDVWRLDGKRYQFVGRVEEIVNVGGAKIYLASVDKAALEIQGVHEARTFAVSSAFVGQMVGLEYSGSIEPIEVRRALRAKLPKIACPARVDRVESILLTSAGKVGHR